MWGNNNNNNFGPNGYGGGPVGGYSKGDVGGFGGGPVGGYGGHPRTGGFALIVVLFILLIIVGASKFHDKDCK
ncbi:YjcZ family sporulation protein [Alteribacillus iranensis]|uniref:Conserved hypothetical tiny transmembrane protein n=1 Tax=Alteribacillus iranensis TaxID=930128 RepID=A0A1I2AFE8_9BACI|nr:YjcZ family sporulation protein [Alteribacillus iranensis]SFE42691.1 conserved hypothetical tiny transmembrane protein [Alteribacillus iranensis]